MSFVITRKDNEGVSIGDIYLKVHLKGNNQVELEIDAPAGVLIIEDELLNNVDPFDEELAYLEASLASAQ